MKIGRIGQKKRVNFREWVKTEYRKGVVYKLQIIAIFEPNRFPTWSIIMSDKDTGVNISRTLTPEQGEALIKEFKLSKKKPIEGMLYFYISENGEQTIIKEETSDFGYIYQGWGWKLTDLKEDIPF